MAYKFKEKVTYSDYKNFLAEYNYLSFMQEHLWAKAKGVNNYRVVGVYEEDKMIACALLIFERYNNKLKITIPNGYLIDFTNIELLAFMTKSIKSFAKKMKAYVIDIYPYISNKNPECKKIHNNLLNLKYKHENEYLDNTKNLIINLKDLTNEEKKNRFHDINHYAKKGISFELSSNPEDIDTFIELHNGNINRELISNLILYYKTRVKMVFAKFDLIYYIEYLKNNNGSEDEINKIDNLIYAVGDEIYIACALLIGPFNNNNNICDFVFNTVRESFENLNITTGLLLESINLLKDFNVDYLKISNINLDIMEYVNKYNAEAYKYIGKYELVVNKFTYFFNSNIKRR